MNVITQMKVEKVQSDDKRTIVETTGARYTVYHSNPGRIEAVQKINGPRPVFTMEFQTSFQKMTLDYHDREECALYSPCWDFGFNVRIFADSLLWVRAGSDVRIRTFGEWVPEYSYAEEGNILLLDKTGGCGQYILPSAHPYGSTTTIPVPGISFDAGGWGVRHILPATRTVLACVAPPRRFNYRQSFQDRIIFHFIAGKKSDGTWYPYPNDRLLEKYAKMGNVLHLHWWPNGAGPVRGLRIKSTDDLYQSAPWAVRRPHPLDEKEFRRVIKTSHDLGMRVMSYTSPLFFPGSAGEFLEELKRILETYRIDGIYFDGVSEDILENYEIMKGARKILGPERLLFVHIPSVILGSSYGEGRYVYCPFIDTYADYILRAEHIENFDDSVLRYTISGHNISNAIGFVCNYDYSLAVTRELLKRIWDYQVRIPYWGGWNIYLADRGKTLGTTYTPETELRRLMVQEYFPELNRLAERNLK